MENDINTLIKQSTKLKPNLSHKEELAKRKGLIITNAYKGGTVDKANYKQLIENLILQHNKIIN